MRVAGRAVLPAARSECDVSAVQVTPGMFWFHFRCGASLRRSKLGDPCFPPLGLAERPRSWLGRGRSVRGVSVLGGGGDGEVGDTVGADRLLAKPPGASEGDAVGGKVGVL